MGELIDLGLPDPPEPEDLAPEEPEAVFYLDLGHPACLLVAERVLKAMPVATEWIPVDLGGVSADPSFDWAEVEAAAVRRGLQPIRRPASFPFDASLANHAATFAKQTGRAVAFAQAALRQAYAGARDLSVPDNVLIAASACELHPRAVLNGVEQRGVRRQLAEATALARERGVQHAPAIWTAEGVFPGDRGVEDAAAALA